MDKLVFIDECGFALNLSRLYGWVTGGARCVAAVPCQRGKNCSVIGAFVLTVAARGATPTVQSVAHNGLCALQHQLGALKRLQVETFLETTLLPVVPPGSVLVLDNARIHHGGRIAQLVAAAGCDLLYLPPYSPDFSPIELVWGWLKAYVKRLAPRTDQARSHAIEQAAQLLPDHSPAWFRHCGYGIPFSD